MKIVASLMARLIRRIIVVIVQAIISEESFGPDLARAARYYQPPEQTGKQKL